MIARLLQIGIDRQRDIVSGRRFHQITGFHHLTHIIYVHRLGPFFALQFHLHGSLNAGLPYGVV